MKTILYVYHASNIGGGSYAMLNIIKALDRAQYNPVVLLKKEGPLVNELRNLNVRVYFLPKMSTVPYNRSLFTFHNVRRLINIIMSLRPFKAFLKKINPDIVYLNTMMLHPYLKVIRKLKFKSIIHVREHWPEQEHIIQRSFAINNIRTYADKVIAINLYSASMVADEICHPEIVYDWIDMDARYKENYLHHILDEDCTNRKVYLCPGGYDPIKGTLEVVRAFTEVVTDPEARLLILGTPPPKLKQSFIRNIFRINRKSYIEILEEHIAIDNRIHVIPSSYFVTHLYKQAYCILSYFKIPHANLALAENVILKTPVIAARNEESIEYSNGEELAILFDANDFDDFKNKIRNFNQTRIELISRLNERYGIIEAKFSPKSNIAKLNDVYNKLR